MNEQLEKRTTEISNAIGEWLAGTNTKGYEMTDATTIRQAIGYEREAMNNLRNAESLVITEQRHYDDTGKGHGYMITAQDNYSLALERQKLAVTATNKAIA